MRAWIVLTLTACGGFGDPYVASARIAEARCERAFACQAEWLAEGGAFETSWGSSIDDCIGRLGPDPAQQDVWKDQEKTGTLMADADLARACVQAIEAAGCAEMWGESPESCDVAVAGRVEPGEPCRLDAECTSGWCGDRAVCEG